MVAVATIVATAGAVPFDDGRMTGFNIRELKRLQAEWRDRVENPRA